MSFHPDTWRSHAAVNRIQSSLLLGVMAGIVALPGEVLWGSSLVLVLATVVATVLFANSANTGSMVLRMYQARLLSPGAAPEFHEALGELAHRARLPKTPALANVASPVVNAFATVHRDRWDVPTPGIGLRTSRLRVVPALIVAHSSKPPTVRGLVTSDVPNSSRCSLGGPAERPN